MTPFHLSNTPVNEGIPGAILIPAIGIVSRFLVERAGGLERSPPFRDKSPSSKQATKENVREHAQPRIRWRREANALTKRNGAKLSLNRNKKKNS